MKKILSTICLGLFVIAGAFAQVSADNTEKAYKILESTDDVLAYHGDYSATISILVQKPGKPDESVKYTIFERTETEQMTLIQRFPEADKGKGVLIDGDNIWSYDPISRKFSHTSIKDALADSDIKIDDVNRSDTHWRDNYTISGFEDGVLGKYDVYIITVTAKTNEPSYAKTKFYVRKDLSLVLKEEDFSGSDRLMRTCLYPKYSKVPSGYVPTQQIVRDELNVGENSQMVITELSFDALPDRIFTKAYIEGLN